MPNIASLVCVYGKWVACLVPWIKTTLELDEYLPDLVVTSFNDNGDDAWTAANATLDAASYTEGSAAISSATGFDLTNGKNPGNNDGRAQANSLIDKSVDVIGNPYPLYYFPYPSLRLDTTAFFPYFSSPADTLGILGMAELVNEVQNVNLFAYFIGQGFTDKWGYEFPRDMTATTTNDYEAAIITAQRAADIVTNHNSLHVVHSTHDACGENCAVSAVQEEKKDKHEEWQEVYPVDRHIRPGQSTLKLPPGEELGESDEAAGNGNYVFVIWRHYRGCEQSKGKLIFATVDVPKTKKR
ncbi:MAG: TIGR03756 family integrating conjugative element protein [Gammaproteobacteria bacterium]|nr:TIGR03756 family integrating conjugative element protein [Gammaproteobacteria bacterium]